MTHPTRQLINQLSDDFFNQLSVASYYRLFDEHWTIQSISQGINQILAVNIATDLNQQKIGFKAFVFPQDIPFVTQKIQQQLSQNSCYQVEYRLLHQEKMIWVQEQGEGVYDDAGHLLAVQGFLTAIAPYPQREQQISQERKILQQLIMDAPVAIAMFDKQMRYLAYSDQWLVDFEIETKHDTLMGISHYDLFPNLPKEWYDIHHKAIAGEFICRAEDQFVLPSGRLLYLRRSIQPWHNETGEVGGIIIVNHVINQLVEAREAAFTLANIKSQFLATMSHELRTPLGGIVSIAELLSKTRLTPQQENLTQTLIKSAHHLRLIINDILDFSKLEAAALQLDIIEFDFYAEIDFITELLGEEARQKNIDFYTLIDPNIPQKVQGDPLRLRQVLTNLITNAIKFTAKGEVVLRIAILEGTPHQLLLKFTVADTGMGIAPEVKKRLFDAFTQADVDISRRYGGTGLGLAIAKQLVALMGGRIDVESVLGEGSTFWFTVPMTLNESRLQTLVFDGHDLAMLVVGEADTSTEVLQYYAGHCHMVCDQVTSLAEATRLLATKRYAMMFISYKTVQSTLRELEVLEASFFSTQVVLIVHPLDQQRLIYSFPNAPWQYLFQPIQTQHLFDCFREIGAEGDDPPSLTDTVTPVLTPTAPPTVAALSILVADDTKINRDVLKEQLMHLGYRQVVCVQDGEEVLRAIAKDRYDLIFMDCMMPKLNGYQTTEIIRQQFSQTATDPVIIALTANAALDGQMELPKGMNGYLVKPLEMATLTNVLNYWQQEILAQRSNSNPTESANQPTVSNPNSLPNDGEPCVMTSEPQPLIDFQRLNALLPDDIVWQCEFLQEYLVASQEQLEALQTHLTQQNASQLEYYAHKLKGISRMAAIREVPKLTEAIETLAPTQDFVAIAPIVAQLAVYLEQVHIEIQAYCDAQTPDSSRS